MSKRPFPIGSPDLCSNPERMNSETEKKCDGRTVHDSDVYLNESRTPRLHGPRRVHLDNDDKPRVPIIAIEAVINIEIYRVTDIDIFCWLVLWFSLVVLVAVVFLSTDHRSWQVHTS